MKAEFDPRKLVAITTISVAILLFVTYFVSIADHHNTLCNPFISGCSDITHAGFTSYEKYMLKAILIPTATLMGVIFFFIQQLLVNISDNSKAVIKQGKVILFLAIVGCIGLVVGTSVIDGQSTPMQFHLKGVAVFFALMTVCQVWYTAIEYKYTDKTMIIEMELLADKSPMVQPASRPAAPPYGPAAAAQGGATALPPALPRRLAPTTGTAARC